MSFARNVFSSLYTQLASWGAAAGLLLLFAVIVVPLSLAVRPFEGAGPSLNEGRLQERIGQAILTAARQDRSRSASLEEQWVEGMRRIAALQSNRRGETQEALGLAVARTGRRVVEDRIALGSAVRAAAEEIDRFQARGDARRQEQLGRAVLVAARRAQPGGEAFQKAFGKEATRLQRVDARVLGRLESRLRALKARQAEYPEKIPALYDEAVLSALRSERMLERSHLVWAGGLMDGLRERMAWERRPQDYLNLAAAVREDMVGRRLLSEFEAYGLPAMAGLLLAVTWVAFITKEDQYNFPPSKFPL